MNGFQPSRGSYILEELLPLFMSAVPSGKGGGLLPELDDMPPVA